MKKTAFFFIFIVTILWVCYVFYSGESLAFGIDVSHNSGDIEWQKVKNQKQYAPIQFVVIRATMGKDRKDKLFSENFNEAKSNGLIVGAYHYYDPEENSIVQAENYLSTISLKRGDIRPVLDIEDTGNLQTVERLREELKKWLNIVEREYRVKPIIYTSYNFYTQYLKDYEFDQYPLWIASYSLIRRNDPIVLESDILQFSDEVRVDGIPEFVDGNDAKNLEKIRLW